MVDEQVAYFQNKDVMRIEQEINDFLFKKGRSLLSVQLIPQPNYYEALIVYRDVDETEIDRKKYLGK